MYSYHNSIKKRIKKGELIDIVKIDDGIFLFAFIFSTEPKYRPIRYHASGKYAKILEEFKKEKAD